MRPALQIAAAATAGALIGIAVWRAVEAIDDALATIGQ